MHSRVNRIEGLQIQPGRGEGKWLWSQRVEIFFFPPWKLIFNSLTRVCLHVFVIVFPGDIVSEYTSMQIIFIYVQETLSPNVEALLVRMQKGAFELAP